MRAEPNRNRGRIGLGPIIHCRGHYVGHRVAADKLFAGTGKNHGVQKCLIADCGMVVTCAMASKICERTAHTSLVCLTVLGMCVQTVLGCFGVFAGRELTIVASDFQGGVGNR